MGNSNLVNKLHTLYIALPEALEDALFRLYEDLSGKYTNEYLDSKSFKAHITIGALLLTDEYTEMFIKLCADVVSKISSFEVKFEIFSKSEDGKYIFLDLDRTSGRIVMEIRRSFIDKTRRLFEINIPDKYLEKLDEFSPSEQKRLKQTGSPYIFKPHISIVKLDPRETNKAMQEIQNHAILGTSFRVREFHVSSQSVDPDNQFPVIKVLLV
ncbi:2'-5' RNA ligase family protein [Patescibacteria group bacterium]|nr:2'-5' RNA ligase family protein [Patescibacteria group bacterium]